MQTNIDITQAFLNAPDGILSIHQLSQSLKLPYGTTYNRTHILNQQGIIQIVPQGKAKLCALDSSNPMTKCLLALGGAQNTDKYRKSLKETSTVFDNIVEIFYNESKGKILSSILLSPVILNELSKIETTEEDKNISTESEDFQRTLDFFVIKTDDSLDESIIESKLNEFLQSKYSIATTIMAVDSDGLLGMLGIKEEEAGLAAYNMLHEGIILTGYENFFDLILKVFSKKINTVK